MKATPNRIKPICTLMLAAMLAFAGACQRKGEGSAKTVSGNAVEFRHAKHLTMTEHEGYTEVKLADPWHEGKTLHTYILVPSDRELPSDLPEGTLVRTPLRRAMVATSVHTSLLRELGAADAIGGVCDASYINIKEVKDAIASGKIKDCGSSMNPTVEAIMDLQPDALLLSPYEQSGSFGKVGNLGIPIIEAADYMEAGPLARAEWMKFYGKLFGKEAQADSIFSQAEKDYTDLKEAMAHEAPGLKPLVNKPMSGTWYIPGGQSTTGLLLQDAGRAYPWSSDKSSGALPLSFETVLDKAGDAGVWIFSYNAPGELTLAQLLKENGKYAQFKAFRDGNVWGCDTSKIPFFEETPFHPDRLLRDYAIITHPGLFKDSPRYYHRLKP